MYRINEIFYSLQGEGFHTGTPAVFVRFAGCNLQCPFCDTQHQTFVSMSAEDIASKVFSFTTNPHVLIILTGGEPALQVDVALLDVLHMHGQRIAIETNGTRRLPVGIDWVTVSPKNDACVLTRADEVKLVYEGQEVEDWRNKIQASHYYLQPCSCTNTQDVVDYILRHPHWRLSIQTHKYIHIL